MFIIRALAQECVCGLRCGCNPMQVYIILDILCHTPSAQHGFVQSPERTKERGPLMTRDGPFHKYSRVPQRGDRFTAFSKRLSKPTTKEKLKTMNGNGEMNGFHNSLIEEDCFLFTSESVGEGHPGKIFKLNFG